MKVETHRITVPRAARASEVASFLAQLDTLSSSLMRDLHLVVHFGGHYGQISMLRHQYRDRKRA